MILSVNNHLIAPAIVQIEELFVKRPLTEVIKKVSEMASEASERWTIDQVREKITHKFPIDDWMRSTERHKQIENNIVNFFFSFPCSLFHNVVYEWNDWISRSAMNQIYIHYVRHVSLLCNIKLKSEKKVNTVIIQYVIRPNGMWYGF